MYARAVPKKRNPSTEGLLHDLNLGKIDFRHYGRQLAGRCLGSSVALPAAAPVAIAKPAGIAWSPHCHEMSLFKLVQGVRVMFLPLIAVA